MAFDNINIGDLLRIKNFLGAHSITPGGALPPGPPLGYKAERWAQPRILLPSGWLDLPRFSLRRLLFARP